MRNQKKRFLALIAVTLSSFHSLQNTLDARSLGVPENEKSIWPKSSAANGTAHFVCGALPFSAQ